MNHVFIKFSLALFMAVLLVQCQKDRDAYYEAPTWAGKPIYETLQEEGRFGKYLQLAEKTQYAVSLKGNGLWTVFAPNDAAVDAWLAEKGYASVDAVPVAEANKVVAYSMLFNRYQFNQLSHVRTSKPTDSKNINGWDSLMSVKKRTLYYETIHKELYKGDSIWVISPTVAAGSSATISTNDNNYKYIPFFLEDYFKTQSLGGVDYKTFFPSSEYSGRNIQGASVVKSDISTGNGVVHEVDKVNEPLPNFENILNEAPYSNYMALIESKNTLGEPYFYGYTTVPSVTAYYQKMYPSRNIDQINIKTYSLALPIHCERYTNLTTPSTSEGELGGYTIFAPNNDGVRKFFDEKLADYYASMEAVPATVWENFINAQMTDGLVYPGSFHFSENVDGDYNNGAGQSGPRFDASVYTDVRAASNGFFYGGNGYIKSRYFESVLTEILLRPVYTMMSNAFGTYFGNSLMSELMKSELNGYPNEDFSVLLAPDSLFTSEAASPDDGFTWVWGTSSYLFRHDFSGTDATFPEQRMQRLIRSHVFKRIKETALDFFTGGDPAYGGYGYALNDYGDMVRYKGGKLQMIGNYDNDEWVSVTPKKTFLNGTVYTMDKLMQYSVCSDDDDLCKYGRDIMAYIDSADYINPNVSKSVAYLKFLVNGGYVELSRDASYTVLLPNNAAIDAAILARRVYFRDRNGNDSLKFVAKNIIRTAGDTIEVERMDGGIEQHVVKAANRSVLNVLPAAMTIETAKDIGNFFTYHFLPGSVYLDDGYSRIQQSTGAVVDRQQSVTLYKLPLSSTYLMVNKLASRLHFTNITKSAAELREATVQPGENRSNMFARRGVLHEIDNYFIPPLE
ncbi:MAG: fasciclin domain-containing protein [Bacteroidales bacterium]|jgi:uncharacterized surface protein with fasciclin (FAS1) repeats|nr:fasciclin domain-containing protein [Bacteroidales bacterium]